MEKIITKHRLGMTKLLQNFDTEYIWDKKFLLDTNQSKGDTNATFCAWKVAIIYIKQRTQGKRR